MFLVSLTGLFLGGGNHTPLRPSMERAGGGSSPYHLACCDTNVFVDFVVIVMVVVVMAFVVDVDVVTVVAVAVLLHG